MMVGGLEEDSMMVGEGLEEDSMMVGKGLKRIQ